MRAIANSTYQSLFQRVRQDKLNNVNVSNLNCQMIRSLNMTNKVSLTIVIKFNVFRQHINRLQIEIFAKSKKLNIYIFSTANTDFKFLREIDEADDRVLTLLKRMNDFINSLFSVLLYVYEMFIMITQNCCISLSVMNDSQDKTVRFVLNLNNETFLFFLFFLILLLSHILIAKCLIANYLLSSLHDCCEIVHSLRQTFIVHAVRLIY